MIGWRSKIISPERLESAVEKTGRTRFAFIEMPYATLEDLADKVKGMAQEGIVRHVAIKGKATVVWIDCDIFFRAFGSRGVQSYGVMIQEEEYGGGVVRFMCDFDGVRFVTYVRKEEAEDE